jgi:hypothetical protein
VKQVDVRVKVRVKAQQKPQPDIVIRRIRSDGMYEYAVKGDE